MKNGLVKILSTFSREEMKKFKEFLKSPVFNKSEKVYKLFLELSRYHPNYGNVSYLILHKKISSYLEYNYKTIERLILDLEKKSLEFLEFLNFKESRIQKNEFLRKELHKRGIEKAFDKNIKFVEKYIHTNCYIDEEYFLRKLNLECDRFNFSYINKKLSNKTIIESSNLSVLLSSKYIFLYYVMNLVKSYVNIFIINNTYKNIESESSFTNFLKSFFESLNFEYLKEFLIDDKCDYYFIFEIYYNLFKSFSDFVNDSYYFKMKELVLSNCTILSVSEKQFLFGQIINCCILKGNNNHKRKIFDKELFSLYEIVLTKKYYTCERNLYLPNILYRNILKFTLEQKKFKWAKHFIEQYSCELHPSLRTNLKNYSYAIYFFRKKEFADALSYINKIDYDIYRFKFEIRNLSLMIHYELKNYEMVDSIILSYKAFLKNSTLITKEQIIKYSNFLIFVHKFMKLMTNKKREKIGLLKDILINTNNIIQKAWLLEKINELIPIDYKTNVA